MEKERAFRMAECLFCLGRLCLLSVKINYNTYDCK